MQNTENNLQNNILEKIKTGEVKMTSKQFFFMKWFTMGITSLFFLIFATYIFAYVIFLFSDNGLMIIPFDTESNILKFIIEIPWTLVFLGLISVFIFSITSKNFYKIYKKPFLTFFFSILMVIVLSHLILLETGTMKQLKEQAYSAGIHLVPTKLLQFRSSQTSSIFIGIVTATTSNSIIISDRNSQRQELFFENPNEITDEFIDKKINAYVERLNDKNIIKSLKIVD